MKGEVDERGCGMLLYTDAVRCGERVKSNWSCCINPAYIIGNTRVKLENAR